MKRLLYPPPVKFFLMVITLIIGGITLLYGEGSKDFWDYPGYRLFFNAEQQQQLKVYAAEGEFINLGASHVGITGGTISLFRPDGTLAATWDGSDNLAIINNDVEELAGPTGGGSTNSTGYTPGIVQVGAGQGGVWTVRMEFPQYQIVEFNRLLNGQPWIRENDQPLIQRVVLAWDITVTQGNAGNEGGIPVEGRVYSNEYISIQNQNGITTSPTFFVLTNSGYLYQVDFNMTDPWGFPLHSNSFGIVDADQRPTYQSLPDGGYIRNADPTNWTQGNSYLYEPQAEDNGPLINNKIFFNMPDPNMPSSAMVTDIFRNNTHTTWLFNEVPTQMTSGNPFTFRGTLLPGSPCTADLTMEQGTGGFFVFDTDLGGQAKLYLDLDNNNSFDDPADVLLEENVLFGRDSIFWDGRAGTGAVIPADSNFNFNYRLVIRGGEIHILMLDVENNMDGITFTRLNGADSPDNTFYYDHSNVGGGVSGGGTPGNPLPTTDPFTYGDRFGNDLLLDSWAFIETDNFGSGTLVIAIEEDCQPPFTDNDMDGINDIDDIDDDNDGVPDLLEFCHPDEGWACLPGGLDPSGDEDGDGILNYQDADDPAVNSGCADANSDGICDQLIRAYDTDGDGVPDHFDLDSDNDGITDLVEAGHEQPDVDMNGIIDGDAVVFGLNGFYNPLATDPDDLGAVANYTPWDFDADGIPDHDDLDSDNDGISDVVEAGYGSSDSDGDGRIDDGNGNIPAVSVTGLVPLIDPAITGQGVPFPPDTDGDGVPDWHDLDSDNDGILDVVEAGLLASDSDQDGRIDDGNGNIPTVNIDGIPPVIDPAITGQGIPFPFDKDQDGVPDWHDLDSDNDGILDVIEGGYQGSDTNLDGRIDDGNGNIPTVNVDGLPPIMDPILTGIGVNLPPDTDSDGVRDWHDLDSDNDGINGTIENLNPDPDGDGIIGVGIPAVDANGIATTDGNGTSIDIHTPLVNTDGEGPADFRDLDSDGDGLTDVIEAEQPDPDADGIIGTGTPEVNIHGQATADATGTPVNPISDPIDTDEDGMPDFQDLPEEETCVTPNLVVDDNLFCMGGDLMFSTDVLPDSGVSYIWIFEREDGIIEQLATTIVPELFIEGLVPTNTGNYSVQIVTDTCISDTSNIVRVDVKVGGLEEAIITSSAPVDNPACEGDIVTLTVTDDPDAVYEWIGPDGSVISTESIVTFENASSSINGEYSVNITKDSCPAVLGPVIIQVNSKPITPAINSNNINFCPGESIVLTTDIATGTTISYQWLFDNGDSTVIVTTTTSPDLTLDQAGTDNSGNYSVVVLDGTCASDPSEAIAITVQPALQNPSITVEPEGACEGETISLSATVYDGATYEWTGPDGFVSTDSVIIFENASTAINGDYTLVITLNDCPTTVGPVAIQVSPKPATPTINSANNNLCPGEPLVLITDAATGTAITYQWSIEIEGEGSIVSTTEEPTLTIDPANPDNAGNYSVVVLDGTCASDPSEAIAITVQPELENPAITVEPEGACEGETVTLSVTSYEGASYEWTGPSGFTSTDSVIIFENASAAINGDYTVVITLNGCPTTLGPATIQLSQKPATPNIGADNEQVCPEDALVLNTDVATGDAISYEWSVEVDGATTIVGITDEPSLTIEDFQEVNVGNYSVVVKDGTCASDPSTPITISLLENLEDITAASNSPICEGDTLNLTATALENATYTWTGPGDFSSDQANSSIPNATADATGAYTLTVSVGSCSATLDPISVTVTPKPDPAIITLDNASVCEGNPASITVTTPTTIPDGTEIQIINIETGETVATGTTSTLEVPTDANSSGTYAAIIVENGCPSDPSNTVDLVVTAKPDESAMIIAPDNTCGDAMQEIEAVAPTEGIGTWSSPDPDIIFADPTSSTTTVSGLSMGANTVIWTLSNEACGEYDSDMVTLNVMDPTTTANDDAFTIDFNTNLSGGNIIGNDVPGEGTITIINGPTNGTATISGGAVNYTPDNNFFGTDQIEYELQNAACPNSPPDRAFININVVDNPDCFVPDVITPNNDGLNDALIIPCADSNPTAIKIFNRWGDLVYESNNYNNDWAGTHDGNNLPPGPYYYILEVNASGAEPVTGCVAIAR